MRFQSQGNLWMFADSYIEKKCPNFGQSLDLSGGIMDLDSNLLCIP